MKTTIQEKLENLKQDLRSDGRRAEYSVVCDAIDEIKRLTVLVNKPTITFTQEPKSQSLKNGTYAEIPKSKITQELLDALSNTKYGVTCYFDNVDLNYYPDWVYICMEDGRIDVCDYGADNEITYDKFLSALKNNSNA